MKLYRPSHQRGVTRIDWLDSRHSFSFGQYHDPANMGWGPLRVINDDSIAGGGGFPTHPHRDMEIFSYVTSGALSHEDSLGNHETITPGRIQLMSAGSGVLHSEFNPSEDEPVRLLQIWIEPDTIGIDPVYQDLQLESETDRNQWKLLMSPDRENGSLKIHQDARVYSLKLDPGKQIDVPDSRGRKAFLHLIDGQIRGTDLIMTGGDALAIEDEVAFNIHAETESELLFFDLPR